MNPASPRLQSLDAFRGLTIAAMLLVNNPGLWAESAGYAQLRHAAWNGWTLTDAIFPFFLFIVGVSMALSFERRLAQPGERSALLRHVAGRAAALVVLGLFQSRFPFLQRSPQGFWAELAAVGPAGVALRGAIVALVLAAAALLSAQTHRRRWARLLAMAVFVAAASLPWARAGDLQWLGRQLAESRVPGVLFRIGICSLVAAAIGLTSPQSRRLVTWIAVLLGGYAVWMLYVPVPGFGRPDLSIDLAAASRAAPPVLPNWCAWVDARAFGTRCYQTVRDPHTGAMLWGFDPEGLVSTIPAIATVLMGVLCGRALIGGLTQVRRRLRGLLAAGAALCVVGWLVGLWIPINKQLWTSSYALLMGGFACCCLAACAYAIEVRAWRGPALPWVWYGRNAILVFLGSSLAATLSLHLRVPARAADGAMTLMPLKSWLYERLFASWAPPRPASLAFALCVVLVWAAVAAALHRRRIFVKL
jgi:predicted acyltransferase